MSAGRLDRRIQFLRAEKSDNGLNVVDNWDLPGALHGSPVWASKSDISDGERWRAGEVQAHVTTRFTVRWSLFTAGIDPRDRLVCEGETYEIVGAKDGAGRRRYREFTCARRSDTGA